MSGRQEPGDMTAAKPRRVEAPEVRRAQIVEAAKRRFRETGFHVTTTADIAALAGVSVGLLYRYFSGKEDIIRAIVEDDLQAQFSVVKDSLKNHIDDESEAWNAVLNGFLSLAKNRERTTLMLEIAAETARSPTLAKRASDIEGEVILTMKARFAPAMPMQEATVRIRMILNMLSAMGLQIYQDPSNTDRIVKLTAQAAQQMLISEGT
jgi:AcrR family transcriptional regulator